MLDAARVSSLPLRISLAFTDIINVKNKGIYIYVNSGAGTAYPSGAPDFTPVLGGVPVIRYLVLYVYFVDRCLSFCTFSFGHCVVCSSSIYGF